MRTIEDAANSKTPRGSILHLVHSQRSADAGNAVFLHPALISFNHICTLTNPHAISLCARGWEAWRGAELGPFPIMSLVEWPPQDITHSWFSSPVQLFHTWTVWNVLGYLMSSVFICWVSMISFPFNHFFLSLLLNIHPHCTAADDLLTCTTCKPESWCKHRIPGRVLTCFIVWCWG